MIPFLASGSHQNQKDSQPNAVSTFVEAISRCVPPIPIRPSVMKFLGKSYSIWHRVLLMLETTLAENGGLSQQAVRASQYDFDSSTTTRQVINLYC